MEVRDGAYVKRSVVIPSNSIPSKYETILNIGRREKDGFSSRTYRFSSQENELPGPGYYHKPSSLEKNEPSVSKKGFGNFVSKERRFFDAPVPLFNPPGPGNYEAPTFTMDSFLRPSNRLVGTHSFAESPHCSLKKFKDGEVRNPGPGHYDVVKPSNSIYAPKSSASHSVFKSRSKRPIAGYEKREENSSPIRRVSTIPCANPIPRVDYDRLHTQVPHHENLPSAVFRSRTNRAFSNISETKRVQKTMDNVDTTPQSNSLKATEKSKGEPVKPLSIFANTGRIDRFGNVINRVTEDFATPGPGYYHRGEGSKSPTPPSSCFKSGTSRFSEKMEKVPFYDPKIPEKKSFLVNSHGQWV